MIHSELDFLQVGAWIVVATEMAVMKGLSIILV